MAPPAQLLSRRCTTNTSGSPSEALISKPPSEPYSSPQAQPLASHLRKLARAPSERGGEGGGGDPHGTRWPGHDLAHWEVVERHNAPLPPNYLKYCHGRPCHLHVLIRRLRAHPASTCRWLAPRGAAGFLHALGEGVSGGLVQYRCGLGDLKIAFLHQLLVHLVSL